MHILLLNTSVRNAGWSMDFLLTQALQEAGVATTCLDYHVHEYRLATQLQKFENDFDAVLLQRGTGYSIPVSLLRALQRPRFFLFTELVARHPRQHYLLQNNLFDHVFLRSWKCIETVTAQGWLLPHQVSLVRSAAAPTLHHPRSVTDQEFDTDTGPHTRSGQQVTGRQGQDKDIDVLFVGALMPRRRELLDRLSQEFSVTVRSAYGHEMVELINRAKIILNLHAEEPLDTETRVYEVLACKGFLITEKLASENPFVHEVHLVESPTFEELKQNIAYYLQHPAERSRIAEAGYQAVIAEHTYTQQARHLIKTIQPFVDGRSSVEAPINHRLLRRAQFEESMQRLILPARRTLGPLRQRLLRSRK